MMSSRWPRPIGIIASIAFRPVWSGSVTGWRNTTPGALRSRGISVSSPAMAPCPSRGVPRGFTTLPSIFSPTLIEAILPVLRTVIPSLTSSVGPRRTAPTLSSSRFITTPITPLSNSSSSPASALVRPYILATPSLTWSTRPTSSKRAEVSISFSCWRRTSVTSLGFNMLFCAIAK